MRISISIIISILCLLCSCCKDNLYVYPDKKVSIYNGDSYYVYYDGLKILPKYKNLLISHTTFSIDNWDDDRLCAINLKTGKADWYFPSDLSKAYKCAFDGFPYMYDKYIVFKYIENFPYNLYGKVVCINLDNQDILWERQEPDTDIRTGNDIIGNGEYCYFIENRKILRGNIKTGNMECLYSTAENKLSYLNISDDGNIFFFEFKSIYLNEDKSDYYNEIYAVIIDKSSGKELFRHNIKPFDNTSALQYTGKGRVQDGILYANVDTYITAVDIKTGQQLWERDDPEAYILEDLIVYNGVVLKCGGNSTYGYNAQTGELLYKYDCFGSHYTTRNGKYAYMVTNAGWLAVIDITTGNIHKRIDCPDEMFFGSYPTFYDDNMYIMGLPNYLYCYSADKMER